MNSRISSILGDEDAQRFAALVKRLPAYMRLVQQLITDPSVPAKSKAYLSAGGLYALSPIDLVPGIIPVAGQLDDAYAILYGLKKSLAAMPQPLAEHHLSLAGVEQHDLDEDIELVISVAKRLVRLVVTTGAKIGRAGKSTIKLAGEGIRSTIGRWRQAT